jgi:ectoine hydroxylase-related dioxygenase (phytanoyl-CoA dioxygenase family)
MPDYQSEGFQIHSGVVSDAELQIFRDEADRLQREWGTTCIRHLRAKSALFHKLANDPRVQKLISPALAPVRSILFDKTPEENWPVTWHQDLTIAVAEKHGPWSVKDGVPHVQPPVSLLEGMTTIRIHLDDTPATNGALRVIAGSHALGRLDPDTIKSQTSAGEVICQCHAGDILQMSPLILHASSRSRTPNRRRIIHFEYAAPASLPPELHFHES